jgi:hypothetical protein
MGLEIDVCSSCGSEKEIYHVRTLSKKYCKECYDNLMRKINCKICDEEMLNIDYFKHMHELHPSGELFSNQVDISYNSLEQEPHSEHTESE